MPAKTFGEAVAGASISPFTAVIVLASICSLTFLAWGDKVDGAAVVALLSAIIGGVLHAAGTRGGAQAVVNPPPDA
jgi:hypothetical protein